jgi:uncharacterized protein (TIGR03067 family)
VSTEYQGVSGPDIVGLHTLAFQGEKFIEAVHLRGVRERTGAIEGIFQLDQRKTPRAIDFLENDEKGESVRISAVYELKDDKLTICFPAPGKGRPTGFATDAENKWLVKRYKREAK